MKVNMRIMWLPILWILPIIILRYFLSVFYHGVDKIWLWEIAFAIGSIFYFYIIFPKCTVMVPAGESFIISNGIVKESSKKTEEYLGDNLKAQKEFGSGFSFIYLTETIHKSINMDWKSIVKHDKPKSYTLKGGKTVEIEWHVIYGPLRGYVVNYHRTKPEDIRTEVIDRADNAIQGYVGELESLDYGSDAMEKFKTWFEGLYGGSRFIDDDEKRLGIWTFTPKIIGIKQPDKVQDAKNFIEEAKSIMTAALQMVKDAQDKDEELDLKQALDQINMSKNRIDMVNAKINFNQNDGNSGRKNKKGGGK